MRGRNGFYKNAKYVVKTVGNLGNGKRRNNCARDGPILKGEVYGDIRY